MKPGMMYLKNVLRQLMNFQKGAKLPAAKMNKFIRTQH